MDSKPQLVSDQDIDSIAQILEDRMNDNARFIDAMNVDDNDFADLDHETYRCTAEFKTDVIFDIDFYIDTHAGTSDDDRFPLLSDKASVASQLAKASELRGKYEKPEFIKEFVKAGKRKVQLADAHVARNSYSCTSCSGRGSNSCSNCSGHGTTTCYKCTFGTVMCFHCGGSGKADPSASRHRTPCSLCFGSGRRRCDDCEGTTKITCGSCDGAGDIRCGTCQQTGALTDFYGVKYTAEFKHNMINSTFLEDEFYPLHDWMHSGYANANTKSLQSPSMTIHKVELDQNPTLEKARHGLIIKIDALKLTLDGKYKNKPISARYIMFDKPWVWYSPYLDEAVDGIAEQAQKLANSSPSEFLAQMSKHPLINEALRKGWDRDDTHGAKWAEKIQQDSLGSISQEAARPIFVAFRHCMENHEKATVRKTFKLPLLATFLLWLGTQYMDLPWVISHGGIGTIFLVLYVLAPYFITSKMIQSSVKRRMRKETGADQEPKLGVAGRVVPILSSALFAATWLFGFQLSHIMIAGRPLF